MARTVLEYITAFCPALVADAAYDVYVELATEQSDSTFFGTFYNFAIALRAMHMYTLDQRAIADGGSAGLVTSVAEGKLQKSYLHNMNRQSRSDLLMTAYGNRLHS